MKMEFIKKRINELEDFVETAFGYTKFRIGTARDYLDTYADVLKEREALGEAEYAGIRRGFNAIVISALVGAEMTSKDGEWVLRGRKMLPSEAELEEIMALVEAYANDVEAVYAAKAQSGVINAAPDLVGEPKSKKALLEILVPALEAPLRKEDCLLINGMAKGVRRSTNTKIAMVAGGCAAVLGGIFFVKTVGAAYDIGYDDGYGDGYIDGYCDGDDWYDDYYEA
jgi:hypothetical protein